MKLCHIPVISYSWGGGRREGGRGGEGGEEGRGEERLPVHQSDELQEIQVNQNTGKVERV